MRDEYGIDLNNNSMSPPPVKKYNFHVKRSLVGPYEHPDAASQEFPLLYESVESTKPSAAVKHKGLDSESLTRISSLIASDREVFPAKHFSKHLSGISQQSLMNNVQGHSPHSSMNALTSEYESSSRTFVMPNIAKAPLKIATKRRIDPSVPKQFLQNLKYLQEKTKK